MFSPDSKWVPYTARQGASTANANVFVQPYRSTGALSQISKNNEDGHHPAWASDGSRLFYTPGPGAFLNERAALEGRRPRARRDHVNRPALHERLPFEPRDAVS